jgi:hypothetical protein
LCDRLITKGGDFNHLSDLNNILNHEISIGNDITYLTKPEELKSLLRKHTGETVYLDIRTKDYQLPVYYLCRKENNYWDTNGLIVEDYYQSKYYTFIDKRFVRLMVRGHESSYLRLSPFRNDVNAFLIETNDNSFKNIDNYLLRIGNDLLSAAWHTDQQPGLLVADSFKLMKFKHLIESIYLILSGDLFYIRNNISKKEISFFDKIYFQPVIKKFLEGLKNKDGRTINHIKNNALVIHYKLLKYFSEFLSCDITHKQSKLKVHLYKLVFGNITRLSIIYNSLKDDIAFIKSCQKLEDRSNILINQLFKY